MRNLFNFILRYYFFFLFALLFTFSLILISRTHQHQRAFFLHSANVLVGNFYKQADHITSYLALRRVNEQLAEENTRLLHKINPSFLDKDQHEFLSDDTLYIRRFKYLRARVINNSIMYRNNFLTLDKGRNDGVEKDMGVITMNGVVGIVHNVSNHFSTVISLLHKDMQISARLLNNDHIGTITWEGGNYRKVSMSYIPAHVELSKGDTIVTSGYSTMFPKGIFIGTIGEFEIRRGENFYTAQVELALDFNKLTHVHVVHDLMGQEIDMLEALNN